MLQIKTIRNRLDNPTYFDDEVNAACVWTHHADMLASHVVGV